MRVARWLPLLGVLPLVGCLLSGQFVVAIDLDDPIDIPSPAAVIPIPIDLNAESVYNDHKQDISQIVDAALLGEIENVGPTTIDVEFVMTPEATTYTTANQVRSDPTAVRVWGPFQLEPGQRRGIGWDQSAKLFSGRQALIGEIKGDGKFTLYALGPQGATAYEFIIHKGVLVVTIDAGI